MGYKKDKIHAKAAHVHSKELRGSGKFAGGKRDNAKFPEMEQELFAAFRERRREGRSCKPNWFKKKAVQIMRSTFPNQAEEFKGSNGWFVRF